LTKDEERLMKELATKIMDLIYPGDPLPDPVEDEEGFLKALRADNPYEHHIIVYALIDVLARHIGSYARGYVIEQLVAICDFYDRHGLR
jgi:hypothetical protein